MAVTRDNSAGGTLNCIAVGKMTAWQPNAIPDAVLTIATVGSDALKPNARACPVNGHEARDSQARPDRGLHPACKYLPGDDAEGQATADEPPRGRASEVAQGNRRPQNGYGGEDDE